MAAVTALATDRSDPQEVLMGLPLELMIASINGGDGKITLDWVTTTTLTLRNYTFIDEPALVSPAPAPAAPTTTLVSAETLEPIPTNTATLFIESRKNFNGMLMFMLS